MSGGVMYPDVTGTLRERTRAAAADAELRANLAASGSSWAKGQQKVRSENPFPEMRERARAIRRGNIRELPQLLDPGAQPDHQFAQPQPTHPRDQETRRVPGMRKALSA